MCKSTKLYKSDFKKLVSDEIELPSRPIIINSLIVTFNLPILIFLRGWVSLYINKVYLYVMKIKKKQ